MTPGQQLACEHSCSETSLITGRGRIGLLVRQLAMDIGPEFLDYDGDGVVSHLGSPDAESIRQSTIGQIGRAHV